MEDFLKDHKPGEADRDVAFDALGALLGLAISFNNQIIR
jgi:hypothetical protein